MLAAFAGAASASAGFAGIILGAVLAGLVYVVIALVVKFVGVNWINKLMPPVVIGPTVALIGLSLAVNAVNDLYVGKVGVMVEGANGYQAIAYDVFYVDNAAADGGANNYNITYKV